MTTVIKPKRSETTSQIPGSGVLAVGELAMNVADGKFFTKTSGGTVKEMGGAGSVTLQNVMTNGATTITDILLDLGANLIFEGNLANAYETTLTIAGELASTSNIGVASFNSGNFTVSSGDVTVTTIDGG